MTALAAGAVVVLLALVAIAGPRLGIALPSQAPNTQAQTNALAGNSLTSGDSGPTSQSASAPADPISAFRPNPGGVYELATGSEPPETVARDRRGAPMVWPAVGDISTYFHESGPYWVGGYHQGLDIAAWWGWNVFAAWDGIVVEAQGGWNKGYGNVILIDHRNGIQTRYAHLLHLMVEPGDEVEAGDLIGLVGSTGASEGPHLHFEVIVDDWLRDPLEFLPPDPSRD